MSYQRFKNDYIKFEKELNSFDKNDTDELSKALDVFINSFDDGIYVCKTRDIENSQDLKNIYFKNDEFFCYFNAEKNIVDVVMKFPGFDKLSRSATNNREIQERLDYLGFLVSRYVTRAFMLNIILSLSLANGRYYSFYGNFGSYKYFENKKSVDKYFNDLVLMMFGSDNSVFTHPSKFAEYFELVNCFDPFINRIAFYFLQFKYYEQLQDISACCLNVDNMIHSIILYLKKRNSEFFGGKNKRKDTVSIMFKLLDLEDKETQKIIVSLYNARCHFLAHAADADWWDFSEIFDEFFDELKIQVPKIIVALLKFDSNVEHDTLPMRSWSQWVFDNISDILDSNFFNLYDNIFGKHTEW